MCILFIYIVNVVSYYHLNVLSMSVMCLHKTSLDGGRWVV